MNSKWLERYDVLHPDHVKDLETEAAINEFGRKMPRHEAEAKAHKDYITNMTEEAAAHHLKGMKVAQSAGDMESSRKHGTMYNLTMKALGHNPVDAPPPNIVERSKALNQKYYRFKPHAADAIVAGGGKNES